MSDTAQVILRFLLPILLSTAVAIAVQRGVRALYPGLYARPRVRSGFLWVLGVWTLLAWAHPLLRAIDAPRDLRIVIFAVAGAGFAALGLILPFLGLGVMIRRRVERTTPAPLHIEVSSGFTRRELALTTARLAPLGGAAIAASGVTEASSVAEVVELKMSYPELPPALEGLRILQLSDVHLGHFIDLDEVESLVEQSRKARPDLVVLTGDIADDLRQLPRALEMIDALKPRYGVFASIGNHEYFRGIKEALRAYDASNVPLLIERGRTIQIGDARLHISGADDPRYLGRQDRDFFERTVATTLDGAPSDAFHVLMSHRPEGFNAASSEGVQLTLAGHTHGAQLGAGGRSLLEPLLPDKYMWGHYRREGSRLYTSSGAGHWFPFRLGCPRELPVIELVRGPIEVSPKKRRIA